MSIDYKRSTRQGKCNSNKKYFGCFLATNDNLDNDGVKARIDLFHKLSSYKFILSGGTSLNNNTPNNSSKSRIVPIKETKEFLSQCKFVIAYENTSLVEGYITEKPFQAYFSGAIPIYNGHKSVIEDLNKNAIIYSEDFDSKDDLIEYIKTIDSDDELYCKIWNQNIINKKEQGFQEYYNRLRDKIYEVLDKKFNPM
ncbi:MAG: alpha-1,3-fucosyltransferase [Alphaproteobacteria bacterium]|nr:alpha-1,3-fucosyltransferase [Alphaproteobacteria bacterium]